MVLGQAIAIVVQSFLLSVQIQGVLKLSRRQPADFTGFFGGGSRLWRTLGAMLLLYVFMNVVVFLLGGVMVWSPKIFFWIGSGLSFVAMGMCSMIWPDRYLVIDDKSSLLNSSSMSATVTTGQLFALFCDGCCEFRSFACRILVLIIGVFFMPLILIRWSVAYLMLSIKFVVGGNSLARIA